MSLLRRRVLDNALPETHIRVEQCNWGGNPATSELRNGVYITPRNGTIYFQVFLDASTFTQDNTTVRISDVTTTGSSVTFYIIDSIATSTSSPVTTLGTSGGTFGWDYGRGFHCACGANTNTGTTNVGIITPNVTFRVSLDNYDDEYVDISLFVPNYFLVIDEERSYATFDASFGRGNTASTNWSAGTIATDATLSTNMNDTSSVYSYVDYQNDMVGNPTYINDLPMTPFWHLVTDGTYDYYDFTDKSTPVCIWLDHDDSLTSLGYTSKGSLWNGAGYDNMSINDIVALRVRTNLVKIRITETTSNIRNFIKLSSLAFDTDYTVIPSTSGFAAGIYDTGVSDNCHFWIAFKIARVNAEKTFTFTITGTDSGGSVTRSISGITIKLKPWHHLKIRVAWRLYLTVGSTPNNVFNHWKNCLLTFQGGSAPDTCINSDSSLFFKESTFGNFKSIDFTNMWVRTKDQTYNFWSENAYGKPYNNASYEGTTFPSNASRTSRQYGTMFIIRLPHNGSTAASSSLYFRFEIDSSIDASLRPNGSTSYDYYDTSAWGYGPTSTGFVSFSTAAVTPTSGDSSMWYKLCSSKPLWSADTTYSGSNYLMRRVDPRTYVVDIRYLFPLTYQGTPL